LIVKYRIATGGELVDSSQFATDLRRRVREAQQALNEAKEDEDFYGVDVRTGELNSLLRMAVENGVDIEELRDPEHGRPTEA
jgi:putative heme degradation protein